MGAVRGTIHAGVCGFVTEVVGRSEDRQHVVLDITSKPPGTIEWE